MISELLKNIAEGDVMPCNTQDALTYVSRGKYTLGEVRTALTSGVRKMYEASMRDGMKRISRSFLDILTDLENGKSTTLYGVEIPAVA
jgi:hypothetical protein